MMVEIFTKNLYSQVSALLVCFFLSINVSGQNVVLTNNGASVYVSPGTKVYVNGSINNKGDSLYNLGHMYIIGNFVNDGTVSGNGIYELANDWENNGLFRRGTSEVILIGANQSLSGAVTTDFYDLTLDGSGVKSLMLDQRVHHYIDLRDNELALGNNTLFVVNADPLAIKRNSGFISNFDNGWLSRRTNVKGPYTFPMGSSVGPYRYRPVDITPSVTDVNEYIVGFYNRDASLDGYDIHSKDDSICLVDSLYYHRINRLIGTTPSDITIYFDELADGAWNGMANWNGAAENMWMSMEPTSKTFSPTWGIIKSGWNDFTFDPFVLIAEVPDSIEIHGPNVVCQEEGPLLYEVWGNPNNEYIWTVTGGNIVGDATTNRVMIDWTQPGIGVATVQEIHTFGSCVSRESHYFVTVNPTPVAEFQILPQDSVNVFAYDLISFVDKSIIAVDWTWDFGDGMSSNQQNPYHMYTTPGKYNVCLWVVSANNCVNSVCHEFEVVEGLIVPNVFTPNNDGHNDYFGIRNSNITQYHLQVYNRWGVMVFESFNPATLWDGTTLSGEEAADGTYYYLLNAKSDTKDYSQHGIVTLIR